MKITIDTKEDSHEEIKKVVKMLQNLVGESEVFTNQPAPDSGPASPFANIFGDVSAQPATTSSEATQESTQQTEESSESTEDLFKELFSEEELKKMDTASINNEEDEAEEESKTKDKK